MLADLIAAGNLEFAVEVPAAVGYGQEVRVRSNQRRQYDAMDCVALLIRDPDQEVVENLPVEFDIPREATRNGELNLTWTREPGQGGNGRGCQVSEIWLIKK